MLESLTEAQESYAKSFGKEDFSIEFIINIGDLYKTEFHFTESAEYQLIMKDVISTNREKMIELLFRTLDVYLEKDLDEVYKVITPEQHNLVQMFYTKFVWLIDVNVLRRTIVSHLIGQNNLGEYDGDFFKMQLFQKLMEQESVFTPIVYRDQFVIIDQTEQKLQRLRDANHPYYFGWPILEQFTADIKDVGMDRQKDEKAKDDDKAKMERKKAKLHVMLYKVYIFARHEGIIAINEKPVPEEILRRLFNWLVDTKHFNLPDDVLPTDITEKDVEDPETQKPFHMMINPHKFRRHFLPLLNLICEKIECPFFKEDEMKGKIFNKFLRFKNFEELKTKKKLLDFIPNELLSDLQIMQAEDSFAKLQDVVDTLLDTDKLIIEEPTVADKTIETEKGKLPEEIIPKKEGEEEEPLKRQKIIKTRPSLNPDLIDKVQNVFNTNVGNQFFPTDETINDPDRLTFLDNFLKTADATEDPKKQQILTNLIYNYVDVLKKSPRKPTSPNS